MLEILTDHRFTNLQTSYMQFSYQTHCAIRPNKLGRLGVPELTVLHQEDSKKKKIPPVILTRFLSISAL